MQKSLLIIFLFIFGCGGSLSDEQRKKMREGMEENRIVKVSDSEIVSSALGEGKTIYNTLERKKFDPSSIDSLEKKYQVNIRWIVPGADNALDIENQLIEAYVMGMASGSLQDNIQKIWKSIDQKDYDSLVYSKPVVTTRADGSDQLEGIWNIYLSRKQIVLGLSKKSK